MGMLDWLKDSKNTMSAIGGTVQKAVSDGYTKSQKESEIQKCQREITSINSDLDAAYAQIGRRFMERANRTHDMCGLDIRDVIRYMEPKEAKKAQLEQRIAELEKEKRETSVLREKEQAEAEYRAEKAKLDKALAMDVLRQSEYDERLAVARRRADNFDEIRRIDQQYDMKLISRQEHDDRIRYLLGN